MRFDGKLEIDQNGRGRCAYSDEAAFLAFLCLGEVLELPGVFCNADLGIHS